MIKLSAVIITYNEIAHIEQLINNLDFVDEIIFVDSYSVDGTFEKLQEYNSIQIYQKKFENFPNQKNFAISKTKHDWILFLDADERIKENGKKEIVDLIQNTDKVAFWAKFVYFFGKKRIRFSGFQSTKTIRVFNKKYCYYDQSTLVHEVLKYNGKTGVLKNKIDHYSFRNFTHYKSKMIHYSNLKALNHFSKNKRMGFALMVFKVIYRFINHYFIRLGIFDGITGIQISYLNSLGIYYRYKKLKELHKQPTS